MKIDFSKNNDCLNVALDGRLDTNTAPDLESFLDKKAKRNFAKLLKVLFYYDIITISVFYSG